MSPFQSFFLLLHFLSAVFLTAFNVIVTLDWLCFSAPEIITLIRKVQSELVCIWEPGTCVSVLSLAALCGWAPWKQGSAVCVGFLLASKGRKWSEVASLWWPWCPRVQIDTSQGNSKPGNRCECVWRLTLHKIPNLILCFELQWPGLTESYFHLHHRC